jgi:hypothetical protein
MDLNAEEWVRKGATLSDKSARAEFGLTQDEIVAAIRAGKLQYRTADVRSRLWSAPGMVRDTSGNGMREPS